LRSSVIFNRSNPSHREARPWRLHPLWLGFLLPLAVFISYSTAGAPAIDGDPPVFVVTQQPAGVQAEPPAGGMLQAGCGDGARIVLVGPGSKTRVLTADFHSACDPEPSFDGRRLLFAAKTTATAPWNIFEMELDGSQTRQITDDAGDCRQPTYLGTFYTIDAEAPWPQIAFVSTRAGELNEADSTPATNLYSCALDGSLVRRLTYNPSSDTDPAVLPDGRLLFSSWQRSTLDRGPWGRISLFASQTDGLDYAAFSADEGRRIKRMPCVTEDRLVVFVENDEPTWDGAGSLASVSLRRNLHSYRAITSEGEGLFHSPAPAADGKVLVSRRPANAAGTHGVFLLDPRTGELELLFDDPERHDIQARLVAARPEPDGRSSVLSENNPNGVLYGLNVYDSDLGDDWISPDTPLRLRVLEGVPLRAGAEPAPPGAPGLLQRRFLGEVPVERDGSFNIEIPANIPIELQLVDADGLALRRCGWIWVRNRDTRGCIGCHEDGERTPENRFVDALRHPSTPLVPPSEGRSTVDFRRDVAPLLAAKCGTAACHTAGQAAPQLEGDPPQRIYETLLGSYVDPGRARTSPLIWHTLGRSTTRPWDTGGPGDPDHPVSHGGSDLLADDEIRTLIEWIDLGALWSGTPSGGTR
jgi:hypothetical protein